MCRDTGYTFQNLYFTNIKKCGNIATEYNKKAYQLCRRYFLLELQYINPSGIIIIGRNALINIIDMLNINGVSRQISSEHCKIIKHDNRYYLILSHWGYYRRQNKLNEYILEINEAF